MTSSRIAVIVGLLCLSAGMVAAQQTTACDGPGAAFGVTAYRCASCGVKQGGGLRTRFIFEAEPVVLESTTASVLRPGDVVVAIDGDPIMTEAGADRFTYPAAARSVITVRRGNARVDLDATALACGPLLPQTPAPSGGSEPLFVVDGVVVPGISNVSRKDIESVEVLRGVAASALYRTDPNRTVVVITTNLAKLRGSARQNAPVPVRPDTGPLIIIDGVVQTSANGIALPSAPPSTAIVATNGRFGFGIECTGSCAAGARLYTAGDSVSFETYPRVVALTRGGVAERAGLRVGDIVTKLDGKSLLGRGARLARDSSEDTMRVTVMREGAETTFTLKAR